MEQSTGYVFAPLLSSPHGFAERQISIFSPLGRDHLQPSVRRLIMNPLKPELMTADERLAEIAQILAHGLIRLHARKSTPLSAQDGDSSFDFSPDRSSHVDSPGGRKA